MSRNKESILENKFEEIQKNQENDLVLDFDQMLEENKIKELSIKFEGITYKVPAQMPFSFATFFFRNCYKKEKGKIKIDIPEDKILEFIERMFGKEFIDGLEQSRIGVNTVFEGIASKILEKWGYGTNINDTQKKI